jgi:integrase
MRLLWASGGGCYCHRDALVGSSQNAKYATQVTKRTSPFVLDAVEQFLVRKESKETSTHRSYSGTLLGSERGTKPTLGLPLARYFSNRRLDTVSGDEIAAWFAQRTRSGAQDTKSRISRQTRQFLRFAFECGYSEHDLSSSIDSFRTGGPRIEWLEWGDVHRLLGAIPEFRLRFAAAWLFYTGCRISEACRALQHDVRLRSVTCLYEWVIPDTKTHAPRSVWLPDYLTPYIEQSREMNRPKSDWPILWDCEGRAAEGPSPNGLSA